jgi:hypothetical protein
VLSDPKDQINQKLFLTHFSVRGNTYRRQRFKKVFMGARGMFGLRRETIEKLIERS